MTGTRHIVGLALAVEGALVVISVLWFHYRGVELPLAPTAAEVKMAGLLCLPLFVFNYLFFDLFPSRFGLFKSCGEFRDEIIKPIAAQLNVPSGLIVAASAGLGEELFFRGVMQSEIGLLAASILFALLHFGPAVGSYKVVAIIYTAIGMYFGITYEYSGSLWVPVLVHALYDFTAILYIRYWLIAAR